MNTIHKAIAYTRSLYRSSLPSRVNSPEFRRFAMTTNTITNPLAPIRIRPVTYVDSACYEFVPEYKGGPNHHTCSISVRYTDPEFYQQRNIANSDMVAAALTLVNGSTFHEALHARLTPTAKWSEMLKRSFFNEKHPNENIEWLVTMAYELSENAQNANFDRPSYENKRTMAKYNILAMALNFVEDLFIESWLRLHFKEYAAYIDFKNLILFEHNFIENAWANASGKRETFLSVMAAYKCVDMRHHELLDLPILHEIAELLEDFAYNHPPLQTTDKPDTTTDWREKYEIPANIRIAAAYILTQYIIDLEPDLTQDFAARNTSLSTADEIDGIDIDALLQFMAKAMISLDDDYSQQLLSNLESDDDPIGKTPPGQDPLWKLFINDISTTRLDLSLRRDDLSSNKFRNFSRYIRSVVEPQHMPATPRNEGASILRNQLHRIATDSRLFGRRTDLRNKVGKPEIIIRVDCSASMACERIDGFHDTSYRLFHHALFSSKGMFMSLRNAGIPVAVYGDTTSPEVQVFMIASYKMPFKGATINTHNIADRFERATCIDCSGNADGNTIDWLSKQFSQRPGDKIIISLSDGEPSAGGTTNMDSLEYTRYVVRSLRKKGIQVYSLSLVEDAIGPNNNIYGDEYNFSAVGSQLTYQLQRLGIAIAQKKGLH